MVATGAKIKAGWAGDDADARAAASSDVCILYVSGTGAGCEVRSKLVLVECAAPDTSRRPLAAMMKGAGERGADLAGMAGSAIPFDNGLCVLLKDCFDYLPGGGPGGIIKTDAGTGRRFSNNGSCCLLLCVSGEGDAADAIGDTLQFGQAHRGIYLGSPEQQRRFKEPPKMKRQKSAKGKKKKKR